MKKLFIMASFLIASSAFADQCQLLSKQQAESAKLLLQKNSEIVLHCKPCGDLLKNAKVTVVKSVKIENDEIKLNNDKNIIVDLAYTFIKVAPNKYVNISKAVGCPSSDVESTISL